MISKQIKKIMLQKLQDWIQTFRVAGLLHSYAAAAAIVSYALRRFCETIDLLVLKRNHYNKETKMRKSRTTLIEKTLLPIQLDAGQKSNFENCMPMLSSAVTFMCCHLLIFKMVCMFNAFLTRRKFSN